MSRGTDEEKKFLEDVRRLLAGEEVKAGEDMSEDYRTAINFAQKLTELHAQPSPQFKDQLKQRLLLQLTRQEVEAAGEKERAVSFWEFLRSLVPQSPVWRTAAATLAVILVTVGVLWKTGMFTGTPIVTVEEQELVVEEQELVAAVEKGAERGEPVPAPASALEMETALQPLLELKVIPSETVVCTFGETAEIELVFKNTSSESITVALFPPAIHIVGSKTMQPVRSFAEGDNRLEISPAETVSYTLTWNQQDDSGEQVVPGLYSVYVGDITIYKDTEPTETLQSLQPFNLLIQNP